MENNIVYIALGSNLGNREVNLATAIDEIATFAHIIEKSQIHDTEPVGYRDQNNFLNMVISARTDLSPAELIIKLHEVEHKMGRVREIEQGPRIIDLDILFYNEEIINQPHLKIPHPRMHNRSFVLEPLSEITQNFIHPILKKDIQTLKNELEKN